MPPCFDKTEEKFYIYSDVPHTHTTYPHTHYSHTTYPQLTHTHNLPTTYSLGDIDRRFAWQAWHLVTSILTLRGRRGTYGTVVATSVCVAGVALGDIDLRFAWQVWHLVVSIVAWRGMRGTYGTGLPLGRAVPVWRRGQCLRLRGRRGTW